VQVFVDVDPTTLNMDLDAMRARFDPRRIRGLMLVHAMGNAIDMDEAMRFAREHSLVVIEDSCEALGSKFNGSYLGTLGDMGTYSFFFSHHITSGEGGAVVSRAQDGGRTCERLRAIRAHGWLRNYSPERKLEVSDAYPDVDPRFMFMFHGLNVRPMEVQAAVGAVQLQKLEAMNAQRRVNYALVCDAIRTFRHIVAPPVATSGADPAWFGLPLVLAAAYTHQKEAFLAHLESFGVETRPIISGNFMRQPVCRLGSEETSPLGCGKRALTERAEDLPGAEVVHLSGLYIGLPPLAMTQDDVDLLADAIMSFKFQRRHVVLVTGSGGLVGGTYVARSPPFRYYILKVQLTCFLFLGFLFYLFCSRCLVWLCVRSRGGEEPRGAPRRPGCGRGHSRWRGYGRVPRRAGLPVRFLQQQRHRPAQPLRDQRALPNGAPDTSAAPRRAHRTHRRDARGSRDVLHR
jgi:dTDP-4-amino-4,6-dideoxygalactose transaminase